MDFISLYKKYQDKISISEKKFVELSTQFKIQIDYYTFERIDYADSELLERVEKCIIELIMIYCNHQENFGGFISDTGVKSSKVGEVSEEYLVANVGELLRIDRTFKNEIYSTIKFHFGHTGLMYRGVS